MARKTGKFGPIHNEWIQSKPQKRSKRWRYQQSTRGWNRKMHTAGKLPKITEEAQSYDEI